MKTLKIDLGSFNSRVLVGRPRGEKAREKYELSNVDSDGCIVTVEIPDFIMSVNSSFFLGMFGESIISSGSRQAFLEHYKFIAKPELQERIEGYIARALEERGMFNGH